VVIEKRADPRCASVLPALQWAWPPAHHCVGAASVNLKRERANLSNNRCTGVDATCTFAVRVGESLRADLFKYEEANGAG
jgi:hypothetical protein